MNTNKLKGRQVASRRKLEEELARTKDPVLRKQLKELIDKREKRWEEIKEWLRKQW